MTRKSPLPYLQDLNQVLSIIIPLIKEDMAQSSTQHRTHHHVKQKTVHPILRQLLPFQDVLHDVIAGKKGASKQKSVPSNGNGSNLKDHGIDLPSDV